MLLVGFLVAAAIAIGSAWVASSAPDGLARVAEDNAFLDRATEAPVKVLPRYTIPGLGHGRLSRAAAGVIGVVLVLLLTVGAGRLLRAGQAPAERTSDPPHGQ